MSLGVGPADVRMKLIEDPGNAAAWRFAAFPHGRPPSGQAEIRQAVHALRRACLLSGEAVDLANYARLLPERAWTEEVCYPTEEDVARLAGAFEVSRLAIAIDPGRPSSYYVSALHAKAMGRRDAAIDACARAVRLAPGDGSFQYLLALLLMAGEDARRGRTLFENRPSHGLVTGTMPSPRCGIVWRLSL